MHGVAGMKVAPGAVRTNSGLTGVTLGLLLFSGAFNADVNLPELPRGKGENCVEPSELMRRNHMRYLTHQRDLTVRFGLRTPRHSLLGCVQCHARKTPEGRFIAVDAPGQFCAACHAFTATKLDCFECHATTPDGAEVGAEGHAQRPPGLTAASFGSALSYRQLRRDFLQVFHSGEGQ